MARQQQGMQRPKSRWSIKWSEKHIFKAEQEGDNISLSCVDDWCHTLDSQLFERFGSQPPTSLAAASLNFSRCNLDDEALTKLLSFLYSRDITVQIMKLFRNNITDGGAWAVGQFMAHSSQAVHEVHLSHNSITERGAAGLLELIAWSRKYPYDASSGGRDGRGLSPIWLRLEHNCIDWRVIDHRLHRTDLTWCTAESRDGWLMSDAAPTICLHASYRNQHDKLTWEEGEWAGDSMPAQPESGKVILAALKGDAQAQDIVGPPAPVPVHHPPPPPAPMRPRPQPMPLNPTSIAQPMAKQSPISPVLSTSPIGDKGSIMSPTREKAPLLSSTPMQSPQGRVPAPMQVQETEEIPFFIFVDAGTLHQMITREDGLIRLQGLLNLAVSGHMKCNPSDNSDKQPPYWVNPVQEGETFPILLTKEVMQELDQRRDDPLLRTEMARYVAQDPHSLLQQCIAWGILEVCDASISHDTLVHVTKPMEARARDFHISLASLKVLDFAKIWQDSAEAPGRVLVITDDIELRQMECPPNFPGVIMLGELNKLLWQEPSGRQLSDIAGQPQPPFKNVILSSSVICKAVQMRQKSLPERPQVLEQRQELHQAFSLISKVLRFARAGHGGTLSIAEQATQSARMEGALRRWRDLLIQIY